MILLDTHALLWFMNEDEKMSPATRKAIEKDERVYVSIATFWEIAIKMSIGKMTLPYTVTGLMQICSARDFNILPIAAVHLEVIKDLPQIHRDPFDRLLICQAKAEGLTLVTKDENIPKYDVPTLWL